MKRALFTAAAVLASVSALLTCNRNANTSVYAKHGIVTRLDRDADVVTFTDSVGNDWSFYGVEDWMIGDGVSAVMNDNGTDNIFDDEVVNVRYELG